MAAAAAEIAALIAEIPARKAELRRSYDLLLASTSSLPAFCTLPWPDLEAHFSARELSIAADFAALQSSFCSSSGAAMEPAPLPSLLALCTAMDAKSLLAFLAANAKDATLHSELALALRAAPDAASLVLDAVEGLLSPEASATHGVRVACLELLERVRGIGAPVTEEVKGKARRMAAELRASVHECGEVIWEAMVLLKLLAAYGLAGEYGKEELLDLVAVGLQQREAVELIRCLGLVDQLPDLIQKLSSKGKQLVAVKIAAALNLFDKFPPVPLLKAYIKEINSVAQEVRKKGNNSITSENEATAKELGALKSVVKAIKEYNLESEYPSKTLHEQIGAKRKHFKAKRKRKAAAVEQLQQLSPLNKHPRPEADTSVPTLAAHTHPPQVQAPYSQLQAPYMDIVGTGPYDLAANRYLYSQTDPNPARTPIGPGGSGNRSPEGSHVYSSRPFASNAGLYNMPAAYNEQSLCGLRNPTYNDQSLPGLPNPYMSPPLSLAQKQVNSDTCN